MKTLSILFNLAVLLFLSASSFASEFSLEDKIELAKSRCTPRAADEPYFFMSMYKSNASIEEMDASYVQTYNQTERLYSRASYIKDQQNFVSTDGKSSIVLPEHFIKSVILQIEKALKLNYVKYVFFPDMGHSHVQVPQDYFDKHFRGKDLGPAPMPLNYYLNAPGLKSLYHTAEKIKLTEDKKVLNDRHIQWRFHTRNILADSEGNIDIVTNDTSFANTVSKVPGYHWNYGISLSAHKNGCFPFEDKAGQIQYFDISIWNPPYDCVNNFCGQKKINAL